MEFVRNTEREPPTVRAGGWVGRAATSTPASPGGAQDATPLGTPEDRGARARRRAGTEDRGAQDAQPTPPPPAVTGPAPVAQQVPRPLPPIGTSRAEAAAAGQLTGTPPLTPSSSSTTIM